MTAMLLKQARPARSKKLIGNTTCNSRARGLEVGDGGVLLDRGGQLQVVRVRLLAEVGGLEQFLDQDDLRTPGGGLAHQFLGAGDVRRTIPGAGHLGGGDGDVAGHGAPRVLARMAAGLGGGRLWVGRAGTGCRARSSDGGFISDKNRTVKRFKRVLWIFYRFKSDINPDNGSLRFSRIGGR